MCFIVTNWMHRTESVLKNQHSVWWSKILHPLWRQKSVIHFCTYPGESSSVPYPLFSVTTFSGLPSGFLTKFFMHFSSHLCVLHAVPLWPSLQYLVKVTSDGVSHYATFSAVLLLPLFSTLFLHALNLLPSLTLSDLTTFHSHKTLQIKL
jgi:hypothetical protein